ncbi:hypothetical protein K488DRAFT_67997 [Vararia minispora EC-137]|uniref:Uncharacterized protein n=1 Tax=Vararia minispora EC-137 TaxID=1314806 RepID=A0ACB8QWU1_9AGAM|nr:hypothetical protein K488DRAFT_67997 [Vararia minispora EC-137]
MYLIVASVTKSDSLLPPRSELITVTLNTHDGWSKVPLLVPYDSLRREQNTLVEVLVHLETHESGLRDSWLREFLGLAVELYRMRSLNEEPNAIKLDLKDRWHVARDIERDNDNVEAVWYLVQLSDWIMHFLEDLMRECVFLADDNDQRENTDSESTDKMPSRMLHLLHPYSLDHVRVALKDIKHFYDQLTGYNAVGENAKIAKNVLVDLVEWSGVRLSALDSILASIAEDVKDIDTVALTESLAHCRPLPALDVHLRKIVDKIIRSEALDKPRLFISPAELISGFARMDISGDTGARDPRDIPLSKGSGSSTTVADNQTRQPVASTFLQTSVACYLLRKYIFELFSMIQTERH